MNISGDYGTELLLRYTEERLVRDLERQRSADERASEAHPEAHPEARHEPHHEARGEARHRARHGARTRLSRIVRFFVREDVTAGGPEWMRPVSPPSATSVEPAPSPRPVSSLAARGEETATGNDEKRMARRELASSRR
ncbi:hypothetical protein L1277_001050 [Okibacterium sp. HSC-33S16]|uniref:hypothetical protein n=1 Tax=Okibacterium sp. HSC-33S16 TaxID=2910965 RepID=UPI00209D30D1|nr:hypothetical protein [Okibacterium sp. HSC-33S16]MCP2030959.1 hypothetical protein [Okibacterium sp. HSC-33S16]